MARFCIAIFLSAVAAVALAETADETQEVFEGNLNCLMTGRLPEEPRSLSFCYKYNEQACCPPGGDFENMELFQTLTDVGLACRLRGDIRQHPLAQLYCLNCDPNQPRYVRNIGYDATSSGGDSESTARDNTLLVCKEWADKQIGDGTQFDECGFLKSSPCLDADEEVIPDRDPYMCGDDIIIPTRDYYTTENQTINIQQFLNADELGTPNMANDYGYKIVQNRDCTDAEVTAAIGTTNSPDCLMTQQQLNDNIGVFQTDAGFTGTFLAGEMCFNGASSIVGSFVAVVAVLVAQWML
eukprot:m.28995 g.28995  ORF g.28995 m.28995 type:complete len:297 (+) comp11910_c0_seq1:170-1060(+)